MPGFLALVPSWAWRWVAIVGVSIAFGVVCYMKGREAVQEKFDDYKAEVKAAGDKQNALTQQAIQAHQQLKEIADAEAKTALAERDAATLRLRDIQGAIAGVSLVPAPAAGSASGNRVCFASDILDRRLHNALAAASDRLNRIAQSGQQGIDVGVVCRNWAMSLKGNQ